MILTFKNNVPLELTMQFEDCYEPQLQNSLEDKRDVCKIAAWMFVDGIMAGEIYGCSLKDLDEFIEDCDKELPESIYCYSVTVLPEFRGQGLSTILCAYWLGMLDGKTVVGHATSDGMFHLAKKFNGQIFTPPHKNWYGTKRSAYFFKIQGQ